MLESLATIYNSLLRVTNRPTREKYKLNLQIRNKKFDLTWSISSELFDIPHKIT